MASSIPVSCHEDDRLRKIGCAFAGISPYCNLGIGVDAEIDVSDAVDL